MITDSLIVEKSKQYDQEIISHLALDRCGLREMGGLERCTNLVQLNLSWNSLVMITDIECLVNLQHLDLSHNQIKRIEGLNTLNLLQFFDIKDNNITHLHVYQAGIKNMHLCTFFQKTTNIYKHDSDDIKNQ